MVPIATKLKFGVFELPFVSQSISQSVCHSLNNTAMEICFLISVCKEQVNVIFEIGTSRATVRTGFFKEAGLSTPTKIKDYLIFVKNLPC